jgi:hypothetical protein
VRFTDRDVSSDAGVRTELIERYGRIATPLLVIGERTFLGFRQNREEIERVVDDIGDENG